MNKILSINELKELANRIIEIPDFEDKGVLYVKVRKPRLMDMASKGQIPNHLIGIATEVVSGKTKPKKDDGGMLKDAALMMELYCQACLVEPTYEDFKDIMTDTQADKIFRWAIGQVDSLDSFREEQGNSTDNDNGEKIQKVTK